MSAPDGITIGSWDGHGAADLARRWALPRVLAYDRIGSTNDVARVLAADGAPAGTLVLADVQDAGRGRHGARWEAPAGTGLLLSMVLRPRVSAGAEALLGTLPLRVALALARVIEGLFGRPAGIKWPNDVLLGGAKVAGILCEGSLAGAAAVIVAGVGVNVGQRADQLPALESGSATSLAAAIGSPVSRLRLADRFVPELLRLATAAVAPLDGLQHRDLAARDALRGRRVAIDDGDVQGLATGIEPDGPLLVRRDDGATVRVAAGTVRSIRPPLHLEP